MATDTKYRMVGTHPYEVVYEDGRTVMCGPGDFVELSTSDSKLNKELIDTGILLNTEKKVTDKANVPDVSEDK